MTSKPKSAKDVFVDAVRDHLYGTPNASHPVQFLPLPMTIGSETQNYAVVCTLCGALVPTEVEWQDLHRSNHDLHNAVHAKIEDQANRYVSPPRYG